MKEVICGDVLQELPKIGRGVVNCCVTSPPYWNLRDYHADGQIGNEKTVDGYIQRIKAVFGAVYDVLSEDGTLWLNMGDTYKAKEMLGIPWRVAFALMEEGWILRQDIVWRKPNAMPENVLDRFTKSHEYIFLFTKSKKYFFDHEEALEPVKSDKGCSGTFRGGTYVNGKAKDNSAVQERTYRGNVRYGGKKYTENPDIFNRTKSGSLYTPRDKRNMRDVWDIATAGYKEAHFATFPYKIPELCIRCGCPKNGVVLDPFAGSGTTLEAARNLGRGYIGIEINPEYVKLIEKRLDKPEQVVMG